MGARVEGLARGVVDGGRDGKNRSIKEHNKWRRFQQVVDVRSTSITRPQTVRQTIIMRSPRHGSPPNRHDNGPSSQYYITSVEPPLLSWIMF